MKTLKKWFSCLLGNKNQKNPVKKNLALTEDLLAEMLERPEYAALKNLLDVAKDLKVKEKQPPFYQQDTPKNQENL